MNSCHESYVDPVRGRLLLLTMLGPPVVESSFEDVALFLFRVGAKLRQEFDP